MSTKTKSPELIEMPSYYKHFSKWVSKNRLGISSKTLSGGHPAIVITVGKEGIFFDKCAQSALKSADEIAEFVRALNECNQFYKDLMALRSFGYVVISNSPSKGALIALQKEKEARGRGFECDIIDSPDFVGKRVKIHSGWYESSPDWEGYIEVSVQGMARTYYCSMSQLHRVSE